MEAKLQNEMRMFERYWQGLTILTVGGTGLMMTADREQVVAVILDWDGFEAAMDTPLNPNVVALKDKVVKYAEQLLTGYDDWRALQDRVKKHCEETGVSLEVMEEILGIVASEK